MKRVLLIISFVAMLFAVDYESQIQPIFNDNCGNCHLGNSSGGLNLSSYSNLMEGSNDGAVIIPRDHEVSELYDRITREESASGDMPPSGSLSQAQIDLIADWIDEGALPEESSDITGCTDPNAITCDDGIDPIYFPECNTCSEGVPCDNYYNPDATLDNGLCMYSDVPSYEEFIIDQTDTGYNLDWSAFSPPVDILAYSLQRCVDSDGIDSDGNGELEYDACLLLIAPATSYLETSYFDEFDITDEAYLKYTFYVHYPNNNYWGSAHDAYYYDDDISLLMGDVNFDGVINVIDIVSIVNHILGSSTLFDSEFAAADINDDGIINVIDIVGVVNIILS